MKVLAIETSCDETASAVVEDGRHILSSVVASQVEEHKLYGGVVPEIASRRHIESIAYVTKKALEDSGCTFDNIDAIAVTYAPGLIGALLVGVNFAKGLSMGTSIPLVPVHHLRSHIASNYLTNKDLKPPFLCLVVSGGHSHIIHVMDYTKLKVIGKTRDDAAGEAFDKAARAMGLSYPGGIQLDKIANNGNPNAFFFPRPKISDSKYDFSFSGLKTSVINHIHNCKQRGEQLPIEDICASFREAVVSCLVNNFICAANDLNINKLVIAGGVSANSLLRSRLLDKSNEYKFKLFMPDITLCGDNAAMVGAQGYYEFLDKNIAGFNLNACANMTIE